MEKTNLIILISLLFLPIFISAQEIDFPVEELGNCTSKEECKAYCDDSTHLEECLNFSVEHGMITSEKAKRIKLMNSDDFVGPGGCTSPEACREFCSKEENMETCLQYNVDNGLMTQEKAERIRERVNQEIEGPGGCKSKEECKNYCDNPDNVEECLQFAVDEGRMTQEKADEIIDRVQEKEILREKQIEKRIEKREFSFEEGPGDCSSEEECKEYCNKFENLEECLSFEVEMGAMTQEEANKIIEKEKAREKTIGPDKINSILKEAGGGPGNCMSQEECDSYCKNEDHAEECISFAKKHGLMPEEKAEQMEKHLEAVKNLQTKEGPGGCKSKEECKNYCDQEENREECINFGREHGMITSEKARQLNENIRIEKDLQTKKGPGGCASLGECKEYCSKEENREECINFAKEEGLVDEDKLKRIENVRRIKEKRIIEAQKKKEMIEQQGKPPEGTNIRTEEDMNLPQDKKPIDKGTMEDVKDEIEKNGDSGFGPQGLLNQAKNFLANVGFMVK
jgi:hypothetical protein